MSGDLCPLSNVTIVLELARINCQNSSRIKHRKNNLAEKNRFFLYSILRTYAFILLAHKKCIEELIYQSRR